MAFAVAAAAAQGGRGAVLRRLPVAHTLSVVPDPKAYHF